MVVRGENAQELRHVILSGIQKEGTSVLVSGIERAFSSRCSTIACFPANGIPTRGIDSVTIISRCDAFWAAHKERAGLRRVAPQKYPVLER